MILWESCWKWRASLLKTQGNYLNQNLCSLLVLLCVSGLYTFLKKKKNLNFKCLYSHFTAQCMKCWRSIWLLLTVLVSDSFIYWFKSFAHFFFREIIFLLGGINKKQNNLWIHLWVSEVKVCLFLCSLLSSLLFASYYGFLKYMRRSVGIPTLHVYSKTILLTILWVIVKGRPSLGGCGDPAQSQMDPFPLLKLHIWRALVRVCNAIIKGGDVLFLLLCLIWNADAAENLSVGRECVDGGVEDRGQVKLKHGAQKKQRPLPAFASLHTTFCNNVTN